MSTSYAPGGSQYLPLAGGTMTGALNMGGQNLISIGNIRADSWYATDNEALIRTNPSTGKGEMKWQSPTAGWVWTDCLRIGKNGVFHPYCDILECVMSNLPTSDPADGLSRIWSDSGVLTLGT